uniref:Uncharacterized protein n=1 Tax=Bursaphelenchus xylophilus TaxID=6326 RepID=A0A1I7SJA5_BURXY
MVVNGEKIELGGQVSIKNSLGIPVNCPVAGDTNEIRLVTRSTLCNSGYYVYRVQDKLYGLANQADRYSFIFGVDGSVIEEKKIPLVVNDKLGVNQTKGTLVYKDGYGMCQELTAGSLSSSWESRFCDDEKITLVPNETSGWHHVQYLQIVHYCKLNWTIPRDELKNVYVRFLYRPPPPKARRRGLLTERGKVLVGLSAGFLGVVLIAFVGSAPFWYKWSPWGGAWRREKKPVPNTNLQSPSEDLPRDSYGNVDCNLRMEKSAYDMQRVLDLNDSFK